MVFKTLRNFWAPKRHPFIDDVQTRDYVHLSKIHRASFARGWSDGEFDALLAQDAYNGLVARKPDVSDPEPAGFVLTKQVLDETEIITIAVDPSARGRGVADRLMREAIRRQQADRIKAIYLEVDETNQPAVSLYKKLGFKVIDQRTGYYSSEAGQPPDALVMRLDLG